MIDRGVIGRTVFVHGIFNGHNSNIYKTLHLQDAWKIPKMLKAAEWFFLYRGAKAKQGGGTPVTGDLALERKV